MGGCGLRTVMGVAGYKWVWCCPVFHHTSVNAYQVCAFSAELDMEMRGKVLVRLQDITELQSRLQDCMTGKACFTIWHMVR
jgi:hypothetical protein